MTGNARRGSRAGRQAMAELPYLARGWLCLALLDFGHREEAEQLWASLAAHVGRMPERAPEWLIAAVGKPSCAWPWVTTRPEPGSTSSSCPTTGCTPSAWRARRTTDREPGARAAGAPAGCRRQAPPRGPLASCLALNAQPYVALTHAELARMAGVGPARDDSKRSRPDGSPTPRHAPTRRHRRVLVRARRRPSHCARARDLGPSRRASPTPPSRHAWCSPTAPWRTM